MIVYFVKHILKKYDVPKFVPNYCVSGFLFRLYINRNTIYEIRKTLYDYNFSLTPPKQRIYLYERNILIDECSKKERLSEEMKLKSHPLSMEVALCYI